MLQGRTGDVSIREEETTPTHTPRLSRPMFAGILVGKIFFFAVSVSLNVDIVVENRRIWTQIDDSTHDIAQRGHYHINDVGWLEPEFGQGLAGEM